MLFLVIRSLRLNRIWNSMGHLHAFGYTVLCNPMVVVIGNQVFRWVNKILGNIKRAIDGVNRTIHPLCVATSLALYQFRFNHHNQGKMRTDTLNLVVRSSPNSFTLFVCLAFQGNQDVF